MADNRHAFEYLVEQNKKMADKMGNGHKVTEQEIRKECEKIAERADRNIEENRRKNGS